MIASLRPVGASSPKSGTMRGRGRWRCVDGGHASSCLLTRSRAAWAGRRCRPSSWPASGEQREQLLDRDAAPGWTPGAAWRSRPGRRSPRAGTGWPSSARRSARCRSARRAAWPRSSSHSSYSVRKPSASTWTAVAADGGDRHGCTPRWSWRRAGCLPAIDMCAGSGIGRPGSSRCQYIQRNASLPQWLARALLEQARTGPTPGSGYCRAAARCRS